MTRVVVTYSEPWGYHINGEPTSRYKRFVCRECYQVTDVIMGNACDRAKVLGETVTVYQLPDGRWTHDKMR